jgi:hypothetical protein
MAIRRSQDPCTIDALPVAQLHGHNLPGPAATGFIPDRDLAVAGIDISADVPVDPGECPKVKAGVIAVPGARHVNLGVRFRLDPAS